MFKSNFFGALRANGGMLKPSPSATSDAPIGLEYALFISIGAIAAKAQLKVPKECVHLKMNFRIHLVASHAPKRIVAFSPLNSRPVSVDRSPGRR